MNFRNLSAWCIRNPVPPIVLFIGLLLAGVLAFFRMDITNNPDVEFPVAQVTVVQPGAAPSELENQVTQRVESAVRSIDGIEEINSSVNQGSSTTLITFEIGIPIDRAVDDVRNAITQIRSDLPDGILEPRVSRVDWGSDNEITFVAAETSEMTLEELSWYIDDTVSRRLLSREGVAQVSRYGGVDREIRVILDSAALQAQGITAAQVNGQLRQLNINAAGGQTELAGSEQTVRVLGDADSAAALADTRISLGGGRSVRLGDIADVRDGTKEVSSIARLDGKQVVAFGIARAKGQSDVTAYEGAWKELNQIMQDDPRLRFTEINNSVDYTKAQYESSMQALIEGAVLAVLVVFLFLRDLRATVISAIAIPLSAIPSFAFMELMDINLNTLSLLALALVAGVLVDDAIVEIENIVRHMRMGKSAYQASIDAADEIGLAVVATTMSIVAVFLPVALLPGVSGQFFRHFGYTVVIAVTMSLLVARMISPLIAAYFLRAQGEEEHANGPLMQRYMRILHWTLSKDRMVAARGRFSEAATRPLYTIVPAALALLGAFVMLVLSQMKPEPPSVPMAATSFLFTALFLFLALSLLGLVLGYVWGRLRGFEVSPWGARARYRWRRFSARMRDHRMAAVVGGIVTLLLTAVLFATLPLTFQPDLDLDTRSVSIRMPPGTTIEQTERVVERTAAVIREHPDVDYLFHRSFATSGFVSVSLKEDRTKTSTEIERELAPALAAIPDARVNFNSQNSGGGGRALTFNLGSSDPALLIDTANRIAAEMSEYPELVAPRVFGDNPRPEITITPRLDLAADLGVTTAALSQTIRIATMGDIDQNSAKFSLSDRQVPIRVSLDEAERKDLAALLNLPVPTARGTTVPLKAVAEISFGSGPTTIERTNQMRRLSIGVDLQPGMVSSDAWKIINELPTVKNMPQGVQRMELGMQKWQTELLINFGVAVVAGILMVFAVLVLLYRRFLAPLVNLGSLTLAPLGAAIALHLAGQPVSMPVFIGLLMLLGIVAKNSILLVDFALEMIGEGMDKDEAILEAGHKRAQPIVMTTVAMVAGMVPIALSLHGDGSWRVPMGYTVIGGLLFSTVLTLIFVPALFSLAIDTEKYLARKFGHFVNEGKHPIIPAAAPVGTLAPRTDPPLPGRGDGPALPAE